jgi:hypothetical protein
VAAVARTEGEGGMSLIEIAYRLTKWWKYGDLPPATNVVLLGEKGLLYAEDKGLVPGEFAFCDLPLTEPGMPVGQIRPGGQVSFWVRMEQMSDLVDRGELPKSIRLSVVNERRAGWHSRFRALVKWLGRKETAA